MNAWSIYEDLPDIGAIRHHMEEQMDEYNVSPGVVHLNLILFRDAIEHVCRIVRVISQVSDSYRVPHNNKYFIRRYVLKLQVRHYNITCSRARTILNENSTLYLSNNERNRILYSLRILLVMLDAIFNSLQRHINYVDSSEY